MQILWTVISLSIVHLTMQQQCPNLICKCDDTGTETQSFISKAECTDIPRIGLPSLISLTVKYDMQVKKNIHEITDKMLVYTPNLSTLILSGCNISFISNGSFVNLKLVLSLSLSNNRLTDLQPGIFQSMARLKQLDLDYNLLKEINRDLFVGLGKLEFLSLANNRLYSLPSWLPPSLLDLDISFNAIRQDTGENSSQLMFQGRNLDLYGNPIHTIKNWNWINTTKISNLRIPLSTLATNENVTFDELSTLTLCSNERSSLNENTVQILKTMTNLKNLTLENFVVSKLDFLYSMAQLKYLKLKQIVYSNSMPLSQEFSYLQELGTLDFEGSQTLAEIFLEHSQGMKFAHLHYISFRNCGISNIATDDLSWYKGYHGEIDLQDNPLNCTCTENNWIAQDYSREIIHNREETLCSFPEDMQKQSIQRFICELDTNTNKEAHSETKPGIIIFQIVLITLAIFAITLCILCLYIHHTKFQLNSMEKQLQHIRLQEVQHEEEDAERTQHPTKL